MKISKIEDQIINSPNGFIQTEIAINDSAERGELRNNPELVEELTQKAYLAQNFYTLHKRGPKKKELKKEYKRFKDKKHINSTKSKILISDEEIKNNLLNNPDDYKRTKKAIQKSLRSGPLKGRPELAEELFKKNDIAGLYYKKHHSKLFKVAIDREYERRKVEQSKKRQEDARNKIHTVTKEESSENIPNKDNKVENSDSKNKILGLFNKPDPLSLKAIKKEIINNPTNSTKTQETINESLKNGELKGNDELANELSHKAHIAYVFYARKQFYFSTWKELDKEYKKEMKDNNRESENSTPSESKIEPKKVVEKVSPKVPKPPKTPKERGNIDFEKVLNSKMSRRAFFGLITATAIGLIAAKYQKRIFGNNGASAELSKEVKKKIQDNGYEDKIRTVVLSYLSQPKFASGDFLEQLSGTKAELECYDLDEDMVYFSIPSKYYYEEKMKGLCINFNSIEWGQTSEGKHEGQRVVVGEYTLRKPGHYFFRFPEKNFRVNEADKIVIKFSTENYTISMKELVDFADNKSIYGGRLNISIGGNSYGRYDVIANHCAFVARKGESSLQRFVTDLTRNCSSFDIIAQKLLDFTTYDLSYNHADANSRREVLKRPNEVLMTRGSDCSGLVILYASLLEQTNIDYMVVHILGHITIAIAGNFSNDNGRNFMYNGKRYYIAESTCKGFKIGESKLRSAFNIKDFVIFNKPGKNAYPINPHTGVKLKFR